MVRFASSRCVFGCGLAFPLFGQVRMAGRMRACLSVMQTMKAGSHGERFGIHSRQTNPCSREAPIPYLHKEKKRFWVELYLLFFLEDQDLRATCLFWGGWFST